MNELEKKIRSASAAMGSRNLARGRPTKQSSTYFDAGGYKAVDGNRDGNYFAWSVAHTGHQPKAWWQVDLGQIYHIDKVVIWNRTDCCGEKLSDFSIWVAETDVAGSNLAAPGVWRRDHPGKAGRKTVVNVNHRGRYVRVQLKGANYLHMAEVEVYGRYVGSESSSSALRPDGDSDSAIYSTLKDADDSSRSNASFTTFADKKKHDKLLSQAKRHWDLGDVPMAADCALKAHKLLPHSKAAGDLARKYTTALGEIKRLHSMAMAALKNKKLSETIRILESGRRINPKSKTLNGSLELLR